MSDMPRTPVTVPVHEVPLEEARTQEELVTKLQRMLDDNLPGFVIRASGIEGMESNSHEDIATRVAEALVMNDQGSSEYQLMDMRVGREDTFKTPRGPGDMHDDGYRKEVFGIHRTKTGSGKVRLAHSGSEYNPSGEIFPKDLVAKEAQIAKLLENGVTDPRIMSDTLHVADLNEGDTVVKKFRTTEGSAILHQYGTSSDSRTADLIVLDNIPKLSPGLVGPGVKAQPPGKIVSRPQS